MKKIAWNGIDVLVLGGVLFADDYPNLLIENFIGNEILSGGGMGFCVY